MRLPALALIAALALVGCSGSPTAVPSASGFTIPDVTDATSAAAVDACDAIADRAQRAACLVPVAEQLLARAYAPVVESRGIAFTAPKVVTDAKGTTTACGDLTRVAYCPQDGTIVLPLAKFATLGDHAATQVEWGPQSMSYFTEVLTPDQLKVGGAYGAVMALSHEYAHHIQTLIGYERVNSQLMTDQPDKAPYYSSEFELMADCFAGWTAAVLDESGAFDIRPPDQWAAVTALAEVGDDFIQENRGSGAATKPAQTFNHGAANERANAWVQGIGLGLDGAEPYAQCLALADQLIDARTPSSASPVPSGTSSGAQ